MASAPQRGECRIYFVGIRAWWGEPLTETSDPEDDSARIDLPFRKFRDASDRKVWKDPLPSSASFVSVSRRVDSSLELLPVEIVSVVTFRLIRLENFPAFSGPSMTISADLPYLYEQGRFRLLQALHFGLPSSHCLYDKSSHLTDGRAVSFSYK